MDPDGGNWLHWKVEVPGTTTSLAENAGEVGWANLPAGSIRYHNEYKNWPSPDAAGTDYDGPEPPAGSGVHHYIFKISALDADGNELQSAMLTRELTNSYKFYQRCRRIFIRSIQHDKSPPALRMGRKRLIP